MGLYVFNRRILDGRENILVLQVILEIKLEVLILLTTVIFYRIYVYE